MHWNRWYAARSYLKSSLWLVPLMALLFEQVAIRVVTSLDAYLEWVPRFAMTTEGAAGIMDVVVTLTASFIVFTFGSMLVAIQVASGQLTPRIIATALLRDNVIRCTVGLFIFTMLFAAGARVRLDDPTPHVTLTVGVVFGIASIMAFLFLIDYTARLLRPIAIVWRIGEEGLNGIETVYPDPIRSDPAAPPRPPTQRPGKPARTVEHRGSSGIVLAVNIKALVALARNADGMIEFVPRVGDFVASGEPLFLLYGNAAALPDRLLRSQVAFGPERTIEQDSTFAFRVIVDIAIKALSPAINDPTTGVLAIDQLHRLLRQVGRRYLHDDAVQDADGVLRLIFPTPNWEDFVQLTFSEIRLYGAENFQISRRLHAMIQNLMTTLPEVRLPALHRELELLDRTLERLHQFPEDLALSKRADLQGLAGSSSG